MKFLFIHQNFPAQFLHIASALAARNHDVCALTLNRRKLSKVWNGIRIIEYSLNRGNGKDTFDLATDFESKTIRAAYCYASAVKLKKEGYSPDVIISHPGWGESLFLKQIWPDTVLKIYCEFFYNISGADVGFDSEFESKKDFLLPGVVLKNTNMLLHANEADSFISPTKWQASTFPKHIKEKMSVIHDGIDTDKVAPNHEVVFSMNENHQVSRQDEVITFVCRSLEPYRGFHIFMRSLPSLLKKRQTAKVLIVGDEGVSYGGQPPEGYSWKSLLLKEIKPLLSDEQYNRVYFLGNVPYDKFKDLLCVSSVHVYLTYPFVLSWSLLESMSTGCAIVASSTPPVEEVIRNNDTGILVDFFDYENLADEIVRLLENPVKRDKLGNAARAYVQENFDLKTRCLPRQIEWAEAI